MKACVPAAMICFVAAGSAAAQTNCGTARAMPSPSGGTYQMVEGLAGQVRGSTISLWPVMIQRQINAAYGVTLEFMDGTTCQTRLNDSMTHGVSLTADRDDIVAAEAAVCDDEEGACVPVRLMFRPLETEVAGKIRTAR